MSIRLEKKGEFGSYDAYWDNGVLIGELITDVDGYYKFWPESREGYYDEWFLYEMFRTLKTLNKAWDDQIQNDPNL